MTVSALPFHDRLLAETQRERQTLLTVPIIQEALAGRIARDDYIAFLTQAFHHVRHTVPLLMACGARLPARLEWLRTAVGEYIEEEMGHHEWILDDLAACGADRARIADSLPAEAKFTPRATSNWATTAGRPEERCRSSIRAGSCG